MSAAPRILAGAMSGTSADGVDIALVQVDGRGPAMTAKLLHHHARPYDKSLRERIFSLRRTGHTTLAELAGLGREVSLAYAAATNGALGAAGLTAADVVAVAAHGQTLYHQPPDTVQWLDPALIAAETGCAVVSDFRRADCAAGGQGAPLVPFADYILFRHPTKNRLVVNIGGIANVTILRAGCGLSDVYAYDTGPGNCISDFLMRETEADGVGYDVGGQIAGRGTPILPVCTAFAANGYFTIHLPNPKPKSTDIPKMIELFQQARQQHAPVAKFADLLSTACETATRQIHHASRYFGMQPSCEVIVSGGGSENQCMMSQLKFWFGSQRILRTDDLGVPSQAKEALAFALLGAATLDGEPSNVPSVTGARRAVVLGSITPRPV